MKAYEDVIIVHEQKERIVSLQSEIQNLTAKIERLSVAQTFLTGKVNHLKAERETLQSKREEQIKKAKELAERIVTDAKQESERILAEAEEEKKIFGEVEVLRKEKEKQKAEKTFLETAIRVKIEELREERKRLDMEETEHVASEDTTFGRISRLPKLPPLRVKRKKRA